MAAVLTGSCSRGFLLGSVAVLIVACDDPPPIEDPRPPLSAEAEQLIALVRPQAVNRIPPLAPPPTVRPALVELGRALAFDPILSGNRDISCMTCHHPAFATSDGRSLSVGAGGRGVGPHRTPAPGTARPFIPRNSPALFNLFGVRSLFHDGRVELFGATLRTPAGSRLTPEMTAVLEFPPLSAVALFPVMDRDEMRGHAGNELAEQPDTAFAAVWAALMRRLGAIPEYRALFEAAYPGTPFERMNFAHASNAIAGFLIGELTFRRSPFDRFLAGDDRALSVEQLRGARVFLSQTCAFCHGGPAFTNGIFSNTGLVQIGPGKGNGPGGRDDFGRMNVTGSTFDQYRFRTPTLRNIELTAPYGHAGQFMRLRDFVAHYNDPAQAFARYDLNQLEPALRSTRVPNDAQVLATLDGLVRFLRFSERDIDDMTAFMRSLTDPSARDLERIVPARVPSGLPVDRP